MAYLTANIPYFRCRVRREYTRNQQDRHGEYLNAVAHGITCMRGRSLGFQVVFVDPEVGGAQWARLPIEAICFKDCDRWPASIVQPWDCPSHHFTVVRFRLVADGRVDVTMPRSRTPVAAESGRYLFTIDYAESDLADDPEQHKQGHLVQLDTGHLMAVPNNRVLFLDPAFWDRAEARPDFIANSHEFRAE